MADIYKLHTFFEHIRSSPLYKPISLLVQVEMCLCFLKSTAKYKVIAPYFSTVTY